MKEIEFLNMENSTIQKFSRFCSEECHVLNETINYHRFIMRCVVSDIVKRYKFPTSVELYYETQLYFNKGRQGFFHNGFLDYIFGKVTFIKKKKFLDDLLNSFRGLKFYGGDKRISFKTEGILDIKLISYNLNKKNADTRFMIIKGGGLRSIKPFLPRTFRKGRERGAVFEYDEGKPYVFYNLKDNYKRDVSIPLRYLVYKVYLINKYWKKTETVAPRNKKYGILGWDTPYKPSKWLEDAFGEDIKAINPRKFPIKKRHQKGRGFYYYFGVDKGVKCSNMNIILRAILKKGLFKSLFPKYSALIFIKKNESIFFEDLNSGKYNSLLMSWELHARYAYIDYKRKYLDIYDPWKEHTGTKGEWEELEEIFNRNDWEISFHKREYKDQGNEPSCGFVTLMRAMMIADYGKKGAIMAPQDDYAVLAWFASIIMSVF